MMIDRQEDRTPTGRPSLNIGRTPGALLLQPLHRGARPISFSPPRVGDDRAPQDASGTRDLWDPRNFRSRRDLISRFRRSPAAGDRLVNVPLPALEPGQSGGGWGGRGRMRLPPNLGPGPRTPPFNNVHGAGRWQWDRARRYSGPRCWPGRHSSGPAGPTHVQWWSYLYGFVLGQNGQPASNLYVRDALRLVARDAVVRRRGSTVAHAHVPAGVRIVPP